MTFTKKKRKRRRRRRRRRRKKKKKNVEEEEKKTERNMVMMMTMRRNSIRSILPILVFHRRKTTPWPSDWFTRMMMGNSAWILELSLLSTASEDLLESSLFVAEPDKGKASS
jgi:hypothetical protein